MNFINSYLQHQRSVIEESFLQFANEGKEWPQDYDASSLRKLVRRYLLVDKKDIEQAKSIVLEVRSAIDLSKTLTHDGKLYSLLDKTMLWICEKVPDFSGIRLFLVKNLGNIARGLQIMLASNNPDWSAPSIRLMDFDTFLALAAEAESQVTIDADPTGKTYTVVPISSFALMNKLFGGFKTGSGQAKDGWCHATGRDMYDGFTEKSLKKLYVIAQDDWQLVPAPKPEEASTAYDDYGMSLIAIVVDVQTGDLIDETLRWNHAKKPSNGYIDNAFNDDWNDLCKAVGFDVKAAIDKDLVKERAMHDAGKKDPDAFAADALAGCGAIVTEDTIPADVKPLVTSILVPSNVKTIDARAFDGCTSLTSIIVTGNVLTIGAYAFFRCESLKNVVLEEGVASIGDAAFCRCSSLETISIPSTVLTVGKYAFNLCEHLSDVEVRGASTHVDRTSFAHCLAMKRLAFTSLTLRDLHRMREFPFGDVNPAVVHGI